MSEDKKIIKESTWVVNYITYDDGTTTLNRVNVGFNPFELLGMLEISKDDIIQQIKGQIKPDIIKRKVIDDGGNKWKT